jgi:hypothetical protein
MLEAIESLLPQVDHIYVYLNGNNNPPNNSPDKLTYIKASEYVGDMGDWGKFIASNEVKDGIVCTVDDDLIYGDNYVKTLVDTLLKYDGQYVVGIHGKIVETPITSWYRDKTNVEWFHWNAGLKRDVAVNVLGTGALAFHKSLLTPHLSYIDILEDTFIRNAADVTFSVLCQKQSVGMVCMKHDRSIMKLSPHVRHNVDTIYARKRDNDKPHTDLVNTLDWQVFSEARTDETKDTRHHNNVSKKGKTASTSK